MKTKNVFLIVAITIITAMFWVACDDGTPGSKPEPAPSLSAGDLPEFPNNSTAAENEYAVNAIMADLARSGVLAQLYRDMTQVIDGYVWWENGGDRQNYDFKDLYGDNVKVSAGQVSTQNFTGNLKTIFETLKGPYNETRYESILAGVLATEFTTKDTAQMSLEHTVKGTVTNDTTSHGVTIAAGSKIEQQINGSGGMSITTGGTIDKAQCSVEEIEQRHTMAGFTVTTQDGTVKVVFDLTYSESGSMKNIALMRAMMDEDYSDHLPDREIEKYSGSMNIYGKNNVPLKTMLITNERTYDAALRLIGLDDDCFDDYDDYYEDDYDDYFDF